MIIAFLNRIGLLRPATAAGGDSHPVAHHFGNANKMVTSTPRLISPITIGMLEALGVRHALAVQYAPLLAIAAHRYQIDASPRRVAAWLATLAHESARFARLVESLNYLSRAAVPPAPALAVAAHAETSTYTSAAAFNKALTSVGHHATSPRGSRS